MVNREGMDQFEIGILDVISIIEMEYPGFRVEQYRELVGYGEPAIALENLCANLYEEGFMLRPDVYSTLEEILVVVGVDRNVLEGLAGESGPA